MADKDDVDPTEKDHDVDFEEKNVVPSAEENGADADQEDPPPVAESEKDEDGTAKKKSFCTKKRLLILLGVIVFIGIVLAIVLPLTIPEVTKRQALDTLDISDETRGILLKLTTYISVALAGLGPQILESVVRTDEIIRSEDVNLGWLPDDSDTAYGFTPKKIAEEDTEEENVLVVRTRVVTDNFSYQIINEDDITGDTSGSETADFLRQEKFVPLRDNFRFINDEDALMDMKEDLKLRPLGIENGYLLPVPYHDWDEMTSDETISRIFWYGIGAVLILGPEFSEIYSDASTGNVTELVGYQIDMESLSSLPTRDGYRPYGFRVQFDLNQQLTSIYDTTEERIILPTEGKDWELAKFSLKQTVLTVITAREHLQWAHLIGSNTLSRANILNLPPNHPIRRLLTIFTFNTNSVNTGAEEFLVPELGWVHRMTGFPHSSLLAVFDAGYGLCNIFQPFRNVSVPDGVLALSEAGRFPFLTEGREFFEVVHDLVSEWFSMSGDAVSDEFAVAFYNDLAKASKGQAYELPAYSEANLIDSITQLIWVVTAYHELVGTVVDYTQAPDYMNFRAVPNRLKADTEAYILAALLTGLTGLREPKLIADFSNFIGVGGPEWEVSVWKNFQDNVVAQSESVAAANAARVAAGLPEFNSMDPAQFECAISL